MTIAELAHQLGDAQRTTNGWKCRCPAHDDNYASLSLTEGNRQAVLFSCMSQRCTPAEIIAALEARNLCPVDHKHMNGGGFTPAVNTEKSHKTKPEELTAIMPIPDDAPLPPSQPKPDMRWEYRDADGKLLGVIDRFDLKEQIGADGKVGKDIKPWTYCRSEGGALGWRRKQFPEPRPLYGLDRLAKNPDWPVLVVFGEKCADAGTARLSTYVTISWPGGEQALDKVDLTPLKGRSQIVCWPDNDSVGRLTGQRFRDRMLKVDPQAKVRILTPDEGWPDKFDIADAVKQEWKREQLLAFIETESIPQNSDTKNLGDDGNRFFVTLGVDHQTYYYRRVKNPQVIAISASGHANRGNLLSLAPLAFWEARWMGTKGVDWTAAASAVMEMCRDKNVFHPSDIRGRGAWLEDDGRLIFHTGQKLYVNGKDTPLHLFKSRYAYEADWDLNLDLNAPLMDHQAREILELCRALHWRKPVSGDLLAGWIVLAPFSGALVWRPHIWLTGTSGAGKTVLLNDVVRRLVAIAQHFEGSTTSSGVRQSLKCDSLPVLFDEAERTDNNSDNRIQELVGLIISASGSQGKIARGTTHQEAIASMARSCFCLASVNPALDRQALSRRITPLELLKTNNPEEYRTRIRPKILALPSGEALIARTQKQFRILRANIETFRAAVAEEFKDQAEGDQFGPLMAAAFSLTAAREITLEEAIVYVRKRDWTEHQLTHDEQDEQQIVLRFVGHIVRMVRSAGPVERTVGELIRITLQDRLDDGVSMKEAYDQLNRMGIQPTPDGGFLLVAERSEELHKIFQGTQWAKNFRDSLERLPGAARAPAITRFAGGRGQKALLIPLPALFADGEPGGDRKQA